MKRTKPKRIEIRPKIIVSRLVRPARMNPKVHKFNVKRKRKHSR